jgi:alkylation response protein AidB-like acyl-CoA dehydrogenase
VVEVVERATVALAAELVGVSRWLLDTTLAYVNERVQFGKPVGSFQGLQWELVDMALDHERAAAAVYYAAMAVDADDSDRHRAVHVAKAAAGTAARHSARTGLQAHGGIGYTWEHDLHLYLRRAYAGDDLLGDTAYHHDRLAELLLDEPSSPPPGSG